jgi:cell division protein FtsL
MKNSRKTQHNFSKRMKSILILFLLLVIPFLKVYLSIKVDSVLQDVRTAEMKKKKVLSETERLRSNIERLQNIDRVSKIADEKLGMVINTDKPMALDLEGLNEVEDMKRDFAKNQSQTKNIKLAGVQ